MEDDGTGSGERVPRSRLWLHTQADGWSRLRLGLVRFDVPRAGVYRLEVGGNAPSAADEPHAFVLMPPGGVGLPLAISTSSADVSDLRKSAVDDDDGCARWRGSRA